MSTGAATLLRDPHGLSLAREGGEHFVDFEELYREYRSMVASTVRVMVGPDEAEDVVQNVFLEIFRSLPRFRGESKVKTWIYRITVNVALQHRRKRGRKRWLRLFFESNAIEELSGGSPSGRIESRSALDIVRRALDRLTEKKRASYLLVEIRGLSPAEASEVLGVPLNTVRSRVLSARREVHAFLRSEGVLHGE